MDELHGLEGVTEQHRLRAQIVIVEEAGRVRVRHQDVVRTNTAVRLQRQDHGLGAFDISIIHREDGHRFGCLPDGEHDRVGSTGRVINAFGRRAA